MVRRPGVKVGFSAWVVFLVYQKLIQKVSHTQAPPPPPKKKKERKKKKTSASNPTHQASLSLPHSHTDTGTHTHTVHRHTHACIHTDMHTHSPPPPPPHTHTRVHDPREPQKRKDTIFISLRCLWWGRQVENDQLSIVWLLHNVFVESHSSVHSPHVVGVHATNQKKKEKKEKKQTGYWHWLQNQYFMAR